MPFSLDERHILAAEENLMVRFPDSFRTKMMKENGGEIETDADAWNLYPFSDPSDKKRLKRTFNDICRETEHARKWTNFPDSAIAIGGNGSGDQLVFIKSADSEALSNEVYKWSHSTGDLELFRSDFKELTL